MFYSVVQEFHCQLIVTNMLIPGLHICMATIKQLNDHLLRRSSFLSVGRSDMSDVNSRSSKPNWLNDLANSIKLATESKSLDVCIVCK